MFALVRCHRNNIGLQLLNARTQPGQALGGIPGTTNDAISVGANVFGFLTSSEKGSKQNGDCKCFFS
jgi:hypothetical protein